MKRLAWLLCGSALLGGIQVHGQAPQLARQPYVTNTAGVRVLGVNLTADKDGNLQLQLEAGGPATTYRSGTYRFAYVPKPPDVERLEQAYGQGQADIVVQHAGNVFEKFKFLGWGDRISYIEGMVHVDRNDFNKAKEIFERGLRFRGLFAQDLTKGMVLTMIGLNRAGEVKDEVDRMVKAGDDATAAFAFNARGRILAQEGKKQDAVLEYLKTLLLFKPGTVDSERKRAREQAVALLRELNDARWEQVQRIE